MPFIYSNETVPDYILLIVMATTIVGDASTNTILWADDLSVVYNSVGVVENDFGVNFSQDDNFGTDQAAKGILRFAWFNGALTGIDLVDSTPLFTVDFKVIEQRMECQI